METFMKKRYLFIVAAILAVGLAGCDLFDPGSGIGAGETYGDLTITGQASDGKSVTTTFSTTRSAGKAVMPKPETGDTYKILHDNKEVSAGGVEVRGTIVTFKPSSGGISFEAILGAVNSNHVLNFPDGILLSNGNNIGYVNNSSVEPEFETDLDSAVSLSAGQTKALTVAVKPDSNGGAVSYQWYRAESDSDKGTAITGAAASSYTVTASASAAAFYYVRVTNDSGGFKKSNVAKVVVASNSAEIVVGSGSGEVHIGLLPDIINYMLGSNASLDYTVTFAEPLDKPLFISNKTFPGTGKLTIKASEPLTTGIHITRSNVVLNGLKIFITNDKDVPKIDDNLCAILISKRYEKEGYMVPGNPEEPDTPKNWKEYSEFSPGKTINNVEIVNCNINFVDSANTVPIHAIYVDPYTAGRTTANRVKIKNTVVNAFGNVDHDAYCFYGNNADLSDNTFTSTRGVLAVHCIFDLVYGGSDAAISFARNQFNTSKDNELALVIANAWNDIGSEYDVHRKKIRETGFGEFDYKYETLPLQYQKLIKDVFAQAPSTEDRYVTLRDRTSTLFEQYIKKGDGFEKKP
jgi:hypothetical protein